MPLEWFDAVVAMRWAQMSQEERHAAIRRAIEYGEFGADSLRQTLGLPTQMDSVQKQLDELEHRS
jgi:hypothetical protein